MLNFNRQSFLHLLAVTRHTYGIVKALSVDQVLEGNPVLDLIIIHSVLILVNYILCNDFRAELLQSFFQDS